MRCAAGARWLWRVGGRLLVKAALAAERRYMRTRCQIQRLGPNQAAAHLVLSGVRKPEVDEMTELTTWFQVVTQQVASRDPAAFANVDLHLATDQMARMQFMVENGLGPKDMQKDQLDEQS